MASEFVERAIELFGAKPKAVLREDFPNMYCDTNGKLWALDNEWNMVPYEEREAPRPKPRFSGLFSIYYDRKRRAASDD